MRWVHNHFFHAFCLTWGASKQVAREDPGLWTWCSWKRWLLNAMADLYNLSCFSSTALSTPPLPSAPSPSATSHDKASTANRWVKEWCFCVTVAGWFALPPEFHTRLLIYARRSNPTHASPHGGQLHPKVGWWSQHIEFLQVMLSNLAWLSKIKKIPDFGKSVPYLSPRYFPSSKRPTLAMAKLPYTVSHWPCAQQPLATLVAFTSLRMALRCGQACRSMAGVLGPPVVVYSMHRAQTKLDE